MHTCNAFAHVLATPVPQGLVYDRLRLGEDLSVDAIADTLRELLCIYEEERVEVAAAVERFNMQVPRFPVPYYRQMSWSSVHELVV